MSYPINQPITYTAVASTQGQPSNTFAYAWTFDDNTTANTATCAKTWTTSGNHVATVTATDNISLGVATASKTITCTDWSAFTWTNGLVKIIPTTSPSIGLSTANATPLLYNNVAYRFIDYYSPTTFVSVDVTNFIRSEKASAYPYKVSAAFLARTGVYAGKFVLILDSGATPSPYGIFDPVTSTYTGIGNAAYGVWTDSVRGANTVEMPDGNTLVFYRDGSGVARLQVFNAITGSFSALAQPPYSKYLDVLNVGNMVICMRDNSTSIDIYNYSLNSFSTNSSILSGTFPTSTFTLARLPNGSICFLRPGAPGNMVSWDGSVFNSLVNYPVNLQNADSGIKYSVLASNGSGFIYDASSMTSSSLQYTKNISYNPYGNTFLAMGGIWPINLAYAIFYANSKLWMLDSSGNMWYSSVI